jgi:hypothetical protein
MLLVRRTRLNSKSYKSELLEAGVESEYVKKHLNIQYP